MQMIQKWHAETTQLFLQLTPYKVFSTQLFICSHVKRGSKDTISKYIKPVFKLGLSLLIFNNSNIIEKKVLSQYIFKPGDQLYCCWGGYMQETSKIKHLSVGR